MNLNHEIPEAVDEIDVSEDENINEVEEFDFEEIDFGSLNEDEMYAMKKGFGIRKYHTRRDKDGEILWQSFFCDREGFRDKKNELVRKRAPRKETRCGCLARMKIHIDKEKGDWYVSFFVDDHNHELVGEHYGGMIASNRSMTETDIALMNTMREVGIGTGKIFGSFAGQSGGYRYIGFSKKDMYNQIQRQRIIGNGDAESALQYLKEQSKSDSAMYWRHSVDEEGKLQQLFWADGCSIFDYSIFGDVLAFDATYGRNKYKFPVVIFSGVNHHKQTTVFAAGIVSNETEETYVWLLGNFLEAMNGKHPKCVITDGDLSMKNAIKRIFPATHHRLCAWHICNNAGKNIKKNNFHKDFQKVMYADVEIDEFNMMWEELIAKHALHNNAWASQIFDCRSMWARSYIRGKFFAGLHTTSRCEGLHSQMGRYVESGYNVTEFLHHFQRCLSYMRNNEVMEDFKSSYGDELLQTPYHSLEGHAASIYTRVVFKEFREILLEAAKLRIISSQQTSSHVIYKIGKHYNPNKKWHEPSKDVIRMRHVNNFDEEPLLNDILQLTGFSKLSSLRSFNIDPCLITALVERWRPETHTFHLPHGECTITLEDVSLQIGVNVNGLPLAGPTYFDWNEICEELLGKVPSDEQDMRGCELKLTWLFDNFETLPLTLHNCKKSNFVGHESYT
ncbi:hypothetical protein Lal_00025644 [Lupinus albus]|nr:hypothetical protein Lal_00025644 [Lupinus albus]